MNGLGDVPMSAIVLTPHNPRRIDPKDTAIAELAKSIEASGLLQPVVCRPRPGGEFELLAGARRFHAHAVLGRDTILAIVRELDDRQAIEVTVLENLQRENLSPIEEGRGVKELLDTGHDPRAIAEEIGKTAAWVHRRAKLADLDPEVVKDVENPDNAWYKASAAHLEILARMPAERQRSYLGMTWMASRSAKEMERRILEDENRLSAAPWELDDMTLLGFACTGCRKRSDVQPELFDEFDDAESETLAKKARCLDPDCWKKKEAAWLQRRAEKLRTEHGGNLLIVGDYHYDGKGAPIQRTHNMWDVDACKKTTPGAKPALLLEEGKRPRVGWVKPHAGAKEAKPKQPPLAMRRKAAAIKEVAAALSKTPDCPFETDKAMLAFAAVFGTNGRENYAKPESWVKAEKLTKTDTLSARHACWQEVRPTLLSRLKYATVTECERHWQEALNVAELIGIKDVVLGMVGEKAEKPAKAGKKGKTKKVSQDQD